MNVENTLLIGSVAEACGVSVDTIRHYERKGLIPAVVRSANGYRRYSPAVIERVRIVREALAIGFSLNELAKVFRQRASGEAPCRGVRELGGRKLAELDARIEESLRLRDALAGTLEAWDRELGRTGETGRAHLLDSLISQGRQGS